MLKIQTGAFGVGTLKELAIQSSETVAAASEEWAYEQGPIQYTAEPGESSVAFMERTFHTQSLATFAIGLSLFQHVSNLQIGGVTWGWARNALDATNEIDAFINDEDYNLDRFGVGPENSNYDVQGLFPATLVLSTPRDHVVTPQAHVDFCLRLNDAASGLCELISIPMALHSIPQEQESLFLEMLDAVGSFLRTAR